MGSIVLVLFFLPACGSFDQFSLYKPSVLERARDRAERGEVVVIQYEGDFVKIIDGANSIAELESSATAVATVKVSEAGKNILLIKAAGPGHATISFATEEGGGGYFKVIVCPPATEKSKTPAGELAEKIRSFSSKIYDHTNDYPEDHEVILSIAPKIERFSNTIRFLTSKHSVDSLRKDSYSQSKKSFLEEANDYLISLYGLRKKYSENKNPAKIQALKTFTNQISTHIVDIQELLDATHQSSFHSETEANQVCGNPVRAVDAPSEIKKSTKTPKTALSESTKNE